MVRSSTLPRLALAAAVMIAPARLGAVPAAKNATGAATILRPLTLQKKSDLDFGNVIGGTAAGTVVLNPLTVAVTTTGGVTRAGGVPSPARFTGAASSGPVVNIQLPNQPVTLTRVGGTQTVSLSAFTLDGPDKRVMGAATSFDFAVGGTVSIPANPVPGDYVGTFPVTVQYP
jgi:spore coat protein U-like protein